MKCVLLLHSATGNTRLVARHVARRIKRAGHACKRVDIAARREPPSLEGVDLLGVACPTMYFRQTKAMERFLDRLPPAPGGPTPAFQLGTASGEAGVHFSLQAEQLAHKDYVSLGKRLLIFPDSWPVHRIATEGLAAGRPLVDALSGRWPGLTNWLALGWPDLYQPGRSMLGGLDRWLDALLRRAEARDLSSAPAFEELDRDQPGWSRFLGRLVTLEAMQRITDVRIDAARCSRCGVCVKLCPVGCLTRAGDEDVPVVGHGCTGCWACYQRCPELAISGWRAADGAGRYDGPPPSVRAMFAAADCE